MKKLLQLKSVLWEHLGWQLYGKSPCLFFIIKQKDREELIFQNSLMLNNSPGNTERRQKGKGKK